MELVSVFAFGLTAAFVAFLVCRLMKCAPRNIADNYFCAGFALGVILWTFKTSMWAGESKFRQLSHFPLGLGDRAWCFLYDHLVALTIGAGVLVVVIGEGARRALRKPSAG